MKLTWNEAVAALSVVHGACALILAALGGVILGSDPKRGNGMTPSGNIPIRGRTDNLPQ